MIDEYALYKGDEFISLGTLKEISQETGMTENALRQLLCRSYKKRSNNSNRCKVLIKLGDKNKEEEFEEFEEENETEQHREKKTKGAMNYSLEDRKKCKILARKNGIKEHVYYGRLRMGWDIERAATTPVNKNKEIYQKCEENGISYATYRHRIRNGATEEEALQGRKYKKYSKEIIELTKSNGISYHLLCERVNRLGWDIERAATTPPNTKHRRNNN